MSLKSDKHYINCCSYSYMERAVINPVSDISSSRALGNTHLTWRACWKIDCRALLWLVLTQEVHTRAREFV